MTQNKQLVTANNQLAALHKTFEDKKAILATLIGEQDELTVRRLMMSALLTAADNEKVRECTPVSVFRAVAQAAILDMNLTLGESYLVPYGTQCSLLIGYQGWRKKAAEAGFQIVAEPVFANEHFVFHRIPLTLEHTPALLEADRGDFIGAYAAAFKGGALLDVEWVTLEDIAKAKKMSKSPAWRDWENQMRKKLAIKRLCVRLHAPSLSKALEVDAAFESGGAPDLDLDTPEDLTPTVTDKLAPGRHVGFKRPPDDELPEPLESLPMFDEPQADQEAQ